MSWRTVVITERCKLDLRLGYLVVRGGVTRRIFLDDIAVLILENPAISLTGLLLEALVTKKVKVILCDSKRSPMAEVVPYYGSYDCSRKVKTQISWDKDRQNMIWTEVIKEKIWQQAEFLIELEHIKESKMLKKYIEEMKPDDETNREGHAAKVYFNAVFGMDFSRSEASPVNSALNYGYGLILSAFNREITANGYLTQLGLHHDNMFNAFNLSSDLMEPFRILVDRRIHPMNLLEFGSPEKHEIVTILSDSVVIDNSQQTVLNAVKIYVRSIFDALNDGDVSLIKWYRYR